MDDEERGESVRRNTGGSKQRGRRQRRRQSSSPSSPSSVQEEILESSAHLVDNGEENNDDDDFNGADIFSDEEDDCDDDDNGDDTDGDQLTELQQRFLPSSSFSANSSNSINSINSNTNIARWFKIDDWNKTLFPDTGKWFSIRGCPMIEDDPSGFTIKLLKFICWTFVMVSVVHLIVAQLFDDRDQALRLGHIWVYEGDLIVRDCVVFFVVGRLWRKPGIDHLAWMGTAILANLYFESQNFIWFLQHSVTLFQMHCDWPWELWAFALLMVVSTTWLLWAHAQKAWKDRILFIKLTELTLCVFFFLAPTITSNYFHMHHWFAGWLMGMHFNYDVWWSRLAMAWCWGMYVNGIAVYGRDPVLTCEYSYFLTLDNRCPYIECYLQGINDTNNTNVTKMEPVDWRNCSANATNGYHP